MNTKQTGDETEAAILSALIARGYSVAVPFGDNDRYDLVVDAGDRLLRVQCKTGWLEEGCVRFKTCSTTTTDGEVETTDYDDQIAAFAVRCRDTEQLYWVSTSDAGRKNTYLRVEPSDIEHPSVNHATEYEFTSNLP